jgi:uncharacterized membrane protein YhaH (DUF805 family)
MMLGSILWVEGRNNRSKWWVIQLIYGCFIGYVWMSLAPTGTFMFLANDSHQNQIELARETAMLASLQAMGSFATYAALPIWWMTWVNNVRRYHDINKSGWWALNSFIPLIGNIWQIVQLGFTPGTVGKNDYGLPQGSSNRAGLGSENEDTESGVLAKVNDDYLAEYAKRYAAEQAAKMAPVTAEPGRHILAASAPASGGSFGKRR